MVGPSRRRDGSGWNTVVTGGMRLGNALQSSWERLQGHANASTHSTPPVTTSEGLLVEPAAAVGAVGRQLQSVLTKEVELVKHDELVAELVKLHHCTTTIGVGSCTGRSASRAPRPRYGG
jgi:hypothetical protein